MILSFTTVAPEAHLYIHPLVAFIQITDHKAVTTVQKNKIVHRVKTTFQILKTFLRGFDLLIISEIPSLWFTYISIRVKHSAFLDSVDSGILLTVQIVTILILEICSTCSWKLSLIQRKQFSLTLKNDFF